MSSRYSALHIPTYDPLSLLTPTSQSPSLPYPGSQSNRNQLIPSRQPNSSPLEHKKSISTTPIQIPSPEINLDYRISKQNAKASKLRTNKEENISVPSQHNLPKEPERISNLTIARLLEEAKKKESLTSILKIDNNFGFKLENTFSPVETEVSNRISELINRNFQKKEVNSPRFMPSVRQSQVMKSPPKDDVDEKKKSQTFKIKNVSRPFGASLITKCSINVKKSNYLGFLSSRESVKESEFSLNTNQLKTTLNKFKSTAPALGNINTSKMKLGWISDRSGINNRVYTQRGSEIQLTSPRSDMLTENDNYKIMTPRKKISTRGKLRSDQRERLNKMFQKETMADFFGDTTESDHFSAESSLRENTDGPRTSNGAYKKTGLREAIAEYEEDFHAKFTKKPKFGGYSTENRDNKTRKLEETEKKWAQEIPRRRPFTIVSPDDSIDRELETSQEKRMNISKKIALRDKLKLEEKLSAKELKLKEIKNREAQSARERLNEVKQKFRRIRVALKERLLKLSDLKITIQDILKDKSILPQNPYDKVGAETFIKAAKKGDYNTVYRFLKVNRFYVHEFDPVKHTALHWAAKRGHKEVCRLLLEYYADPDALTLGGRTPLYYALRGQYSEIVRLLLHSKANPWSLGKINYLKFCSDSRSSTYIKKARQVSLLLKFQSIPERIAMWDKEIRMALHPIGNSDEES